MKKWKVLIACSSKNDIHEEYYENDPAFSNEKYSFFNVGKEKFSHSKFNVINSNDIPNYEHLGRKYAESEIIYNVRKLNLFSEYDYIGLMHYDFNFFDKNYKTTKITENIENAIDHKIEFISFFTAPLFSIVGPYNVLMDERKPNCLFVRDSNLNNPKSINEKIEFDIKEKIDPTFDLSAFDINKKIGLCCSFLTQRKIFDKLGDLIVDAIDDGFLNKFDTLDRHRYPGQVMERYVAMFSLLYRKFGFMLDHRFVGGQLDIKNNYNAENY